MMNDKYITTVLSIILLIVCLSGCTDNTETADKSEEKTIGPIGGNIDFIDNSIILEISENAVSDETTITVSEMSNTPSDNDVIMLMAYEFGPDGTVFTNPITIKIRYDLNLLPSNYDQDDLRLFVYENNNWNEIADSRFKHNYIQGEISHFSKIGGGVFTDYEDLEESDERNEEEEENNSASISFEVPVEVHHWTDYYVDKDGEIHEDSSNFVSAAYIHWEPQPYARYYEFSINFNNNTPAPNSYPSSCDWSKRNLNYCGYTNYFYTEGETYYLGVDETSGIDSIKNYQGLVSHFDKFEIEFIGNHHGRCIGLTQESLPVDPAIQLEMETFIEEYFEGWTATIRSVS